MPKHTVSCSCKCPYYKAHERSEIFCRGLEEGQAVHLGFSTPAGKTVWMKRHCMSVTGYKSCPVEKMLESAGR